MSQQVSESPMSQVSWSAVLNHLHMTSLTSIDLGTASFLNMGGSELRKVSFNLYDMPPILSQNAWIFCY